MAAGMRCIRSTAMRAKVDQAPAAGNSTSAAAAYAKAIRQAFPRPTAVAPFPPGEFAAEHRGEQWQIVAERHHRLAHGADLTVDGPADVAGHHIADRGDFEQVEQQRGVGGLRDHHQRAGAMGVTRIDVRVGRDQRVQDGPVSCLGCRHQRRLRIRRAAVR